MKKILFLLIFVFSVVCLNKNFVKASEYNMLKKLYVVSGSFDTLDYPGYKLVETDINYNIPGNYYALYLEDITDRTFKREIEVVSKESLLTSGIKNVNLKEEFKIEKAQILKRIVIDNYNVIAYEKDDSVLLNFNYLDSSSEIYLFDRNTFGLIDLYYSSIYNKLYIIGNLFTDSLDIYIGEYSLGGKLLNEKIIKGSNVDTVTNIHINNNYIYLTGYTTSIDGDFIHTGYLEDSFILQLDINTLNIINYLNLGSFGMDYIKTSCYLENLFIVKHFFDRGVPVVEIIKIDDNLNIIDSTYLGTISNVFDVKLKKDNNELFYFCTVYDETLNDDVSTLYKITKDLNISKIDSYYDELSKPIDFNIVNKEISLLYTSISNEDNYPTYLRIINDVVIKLTLDNRIYDTCYFNELGNLDLIYKEHLKSFEYSLVYAKDLESNNPCLMCNNNQVKNDSFLSNLYYDENTFGLYCLTYYYKFDFFDLVFKKDLLVDSNIIVDNDNYYSKGLVLTFKGKGYLNNQIIESGYVINDIGEYELKVIGYDNETLVYNFTVVDKEYSKDLLSVFNPKVNLSIKEESMFPTANVSNNNLINNIIEDKYDNNIWYIIIPICTLIVSTTIFMFIGRKVK